MSRLRFLGPVEAMMALCRIMSAPASALDNGSGQTVPTRRLKRRGRSRPSGSRPTGRQPDLHIGCVVSGHRRNRRCPIGTLRARA
jgi:hypothetical protein